MINPAYGSLLQDYLTEQGFRVLTATDGQNAIYAARHDRPT